MSDQPDPWSPEVKPWDLVTKLMPQGPDGCLVEGHLARHLFIQRIPDADPVELFYRWRTEAEWDRMAAQAVAMGGEAMEAQTIASMVVGWARPENCRDIVAIAQMPAAVRQAVYLAILAEPPEHAESDGREGQSGRELSVPGEEGDMAS